MEEVVLLKVNNASDFCKMDKIPEGEVIQYLHKKALVPRDIDMVPRLGNNAPHMLQ